MGLKSKWVHGRKLQFPTAKLVAYLKISRSFTLNSHIARVEKLYEIYSYSYISLYKEIALKNALRSAQSIAMSSGFENKNVLPVDVFSTNFFDKKRTSDRLKCRGQLSLLTLPLPRRY